MKKFSVYLFSFFSLGLAVGGGYYLGFDFFVHPAGAQSSGGAPSIDIVRSTDSADAIAVRVVPNPNHYSIARWYEAQGFQGSPQALVVDGYEAIRDGRTVYVNASNVDIDSRNIYTNIYLISYNQNPTQKTVDILGQIISHWKFNSNLAENSNPAPGCSISALACNTDTDCAQDQYCATAAAGIASSSCLLKTPKNCRVDTDCPNSFFCDSAKSRITRDIKRLGQLEEMKEALSNFKKRNSYYPRLSSGTYLANNTLSVWPSWTQSLLSDVAVSQNFLDPVNRLGACPGYDAKTCWNADSKKFVYNPVGMIPILPAGSYAFAYSVDTAGANYDLCAVMESRETDLDYHFSPNDPAGSVCVTATGIGFGGTAQNTAPQLIDEFLVGQAGREFSGFLRVIDLEGGPLTWAIGGPAASWASLRDTSDPNQKKIYAASAPAAGTYNLDLTVVDIRGDTFSTTTKITILADELRINAADFEYTLDPTTPFGYNFSFHARNLNDPELAYAVAKISDGPDVLNMADLSKNFSQLSSNDFGVAYAGIISNANKFFQDTDINYRINLTGRDGTSFSKDFKVKIIVEQPVLNFDCAAQVRAGNSYFCPLGLRTQGNHTLSYAAAGLPSKMSIISSTAANLSGSSDYSAANLSGSSDYSASPYSINIKATNEYGASTSRSFVLQVNNYCGDGVIQSPNTEGKGGINNDGYEDCDGAAGVTAIVGNSGIANQYGCRTEVGSTVPEPILSNDYCVFKSPLEGGGYCGDTYCQASLNGQTMETCENCFSDCTVCASAECTYTYSAWSSCQPDSTMTRVVDSSSPENCTGIPVTLQSCVYIPGGSGS